MRFITTQEGDSISRAFGSLLSRLLVYGQAVADGCQGGPLASCSVWLPCDVLPLHSTAGGTAMERHASRHTLGPVLQ